MVKLISLYLLFKSLTVYVVKSLVLFDLMLISFFDLFLRFYKLRPGKKLILVIPFYLFFIRIILARLGTHDPLVGEPVIQITGTRHIKFNDILPV